MAFSTLQLRKLRRNVRPEFIKERQVDGKVLPYVEAWHVISEANRVFGPDGWDRETVSTQCIWQKQIDGRHGASYLARVRLTVRADGMTVVREGCGAGEAFSPTPGQAHERAIKTAETDATKRALATFGSCFGLSLYRGKAPVSAPQIPAADRHNTQAASNENFVVEKLPPAPSVANGGRKEITAEEDSLAGDAKPAPIYQPGAEISSPDGETNRTYINGFGEVFPRRKSTHAIALRSTIDKSELLLGEPKRIRNGEHLKFVKTKPCLVCGRNPSDPHHLRFTQPRALGKKVSDEFTVPLCRFHHDEAHRAGDEIKWWKARAIDPLKIARDLWIDSQKADVANIAD